MKKTNDQSLIERGVTEAALKIWHSRGQRVVLEISNEQFAKISNEAPVWALEAFYFVPGKKYYYVGASATFLRRLFTVAPGGPEGETAAELFTSILTEGVGHD